jgi:3'(2'), 5'-bisphosphate nucleotidase
MLNLIIDIVKETGVKLNQWYNEGIFEGAWEGTQYKAKVDQMAHDFITERLKSIDSTIPIISEEDKSSLVNNRPDIYWIIDPIDGTASFINGYRGFVTQIAFMSENKPQFAAIYAPRLDELFTAKRGQGAFFNGQMIERPISSSLNSLIDNYPEPKGIAKNIYESFNIQKYIECGSIALKICKVANGEADLFVKDVPVRDWDIAAPQLVLEEVQGNLCTILGQSFNFQNDFEHLGIIATISKENKNRLVDWYKQNKGEYL